MVASSTQAITGNFIQSLKTMQGQTQFSFLRKGSLLGDVYYVMAMDKHLKAYWFRMEEQRGRWVIIDRAKVPYWIYATEETLSKAIVLNNLDK
jgi:hypothetical protein